MEVLAHLAPPLLAHLRAALRNEHRVVVPHDWKSLTEVARRQLIDVAVLDPRADGMLRTAEIRALLLQHPSIPVVLYATLSPDTVRVTAELSPLGLQHVVLRGFDDESVRFRELLERLVVYGVAESLLQRLMPKLEGCPPALVGSVAKLFRDPQAFQSVNDLAIASNVSRRSLDRWLGRQGVTSARLLIALARLVRAYHYLRDPGIMAEDVAAKLGYASPRGFALQARAATGLNPSVLREQLSPDAFTERISALLWQRTENGNDVRSDKARSGRR